MSIEIEISMLTLKNKSILFNCKSMINYIMREISMIIMKNKILWATKKKGSHYPEDLW